MSKPASVFLDANVLIYFLDETAQLHQTTVATLQKLVDDEVELFTSHHVVEEVLFIVNKLAGTASDLATAIRTIGQLPGLTLIEPDADMAFAARYVKLVEQTHLGVNDALLIQLMFDTNLHYLFTFDQPLLKRAAPFGIRSAI